MGWSWSVIATCAAAACARGGSAELELDPDAADTTTSDGCTQRPFFADADHDGHGAKGASMVACIQPPNTAIVGDDCDDADPNRFPGHPERCDGVDNDCNAATAEQCPAGCTARKRPSPDSARTYLFCSTGSSWTDAATACTAAGSALVQIDDAAENAFVRSSANTALGPVELHIGASDRDTEGKWVWSGGVQFWSGGAGGTAVGGRFASWSVLEPNNDNNEDCGEMKTGGNWNDVECTTLHPFVCRT